MKKLLALVMALVMVLGLATVGASAAYADQDDINYEEAVDVMTAIGVLAGDETGFRPADTLKRSEGAKIIAYLMLGNKAAEAVTASGTKYTDLPANHWAAGYMEYLTSVGVMGGIGDGKIDPDGQLTATAFGKMLLCALGYDAKIEGLGGADWALNTQKLATQIGLFDGNNAVVGSAAVTREEAALYAFNTIKAPIVEYDTNVRVDTGASGIVTVGSSKPQYVISNQAYARRIDTETATVNGATAPRVEFAEQYYKDLALDGAGALRINDLGEPVDKWTYNNIEIGTYVRSAGLIQTFTKKVTAKDLYDLVGKSRVDSVAANDTSLVLFEDGVQTAVVGAQGGNNGNLVSNFMSSNDSIQINNSGNGSVTEVFLDEDNNIMVVTYHTYVFQVSGNYNTNTQQLYIEAAGDTADVIPTLAGGETTLKAKDFPQIADYVDDDYLLINIGNANHVATSNYSIQKVAKAELLTGEVSAYKLNTNVTVDGETKSYSEKTLSAATKVRNTAYSVGQSTTLVLDAAGYIIAIDEAVVNPNYVFITKFGTSAGLGSDVVASAYFTDGTTETLKIDKVYDLNGAAITKANLYLPTTSAWTTEMTDPALGSVSVAYAGWYTYGKNANGSYTLYQPKATALRQAGYSYGASENTIVANDKVLFLGANASGTDENAALANATATTYNTIRANNKTVFVVNDETANDVYVYTGVKSAPEISTKGTGAAFVMAAYNPNNSYASYVFVTVENANIFDGSNEALLYIVGQEGEYHKANNSVYYKWRIVDESAAITTVDATDGTTLTYEAVYRVRKNADGEISNAVRINTLDGAAGGFGATYADGKYIRTATVSNGGATNTTATGKITYNNDTLWLNGLPFTLAKDAKITLVVTSGAPMLLDDKAADREATIVSAATLASKLSGYPMAQYSAQARLSDTWGGGSTEIEELYVTVGNSAYSAVIDGTSATALSQIKAALAVANASVMVTGANVTLTGALDVPTGTVLEFAGNLNTSVNPLNINGTMIVGGNLVDSGHINANGTMIVNGTTVISGTSLDVASGANVTLKDNVTIRGTLTTAAGSTLALATTNGDVTIVGSNAVVDLEGTTTVGSSYNTGADLLIQGSGSNVELNGTIEIYNALNISTPGVTISGDITTASATTSEAINTSSGGTVTTTGGSDVQTSSSSGNWTGVTHSDNSSSKVTVTVSYDIGAEIKIADYPKTVSSPSSSKGTPVVRVGALTQTDDHAADPEQVYVAAGDTVTMTITISDSTGALPTAQSYFTVSGGSTGSWKIDSYKGNATSATLGVTWTKN